MPLRDFECRIGETSSVCDVYKYENPMILAKYVISKGSLEESQIHKIAKQIVDAFKRLAELKVFHRNFKPQNALIVDQLLVKMCGYELIIKESLKEEIY